MRLTNQTILITGASSGLGHGVALALAKQNNNLIVTARRADRLEALKAEIEKLGSRCLVVPADAVDTAAAQKVMDEGIRTFGRIDAALLNAGGGNAVRSDETTPAEVLRQMRMNYDTLANFLIPLIQHMKGTGGTIAYTCSPAGSFGLPKSGPYSAAKAAGRTLFDTCRIENARTPIKFVALYPGFTYTDGLDPKEVPVKALIIEKDRAVREMVRAMERGASHHMFPKRIAFLIALARLMPEPIRRRVLAVGA